MPIYGVEYPVTHERFAREAYRTKQFYTAALLLLHGIAVQALPTAERLAYGTVQLSVCVEQGELFLRCNDRPAFSLGTLLLLYGHIKGHLSVSRGIHRVPVKHRSADRARQHSTPWSAKIGIIASLGMVREMDEGFGYGLPSGTTADFRSCETIQRYFGYCDRTGLES